MKIKKNVIREWNSWHGFQKKLRSLFGMCKKSREEI